MLFLMFKLINMPEFRGHNSISKHPIHTMFVVVSPLLLALAVNAQIPPISHSEV